MTEKKTRGTKLGHRLRQLSDKPEFAEKKERLILAATDLDRTAIVLGLRGDRIKQTAAYQYAVRLFERTTGARYRG